MTLKISISGVRGFVPDSLTPEVCLNFAKAFGSYLVNQQKTSTPPKVVIGTDPRASSEFIKGIVFSGLLSCGCQVIDLGIAPTPTVGLMVRQLKAAGGIVITASHNPLPWNGLKFMRDDGIFLNEQQAQKLIKRFEEKDFIAGLPQSVVFNHTAIDLHIKKVLKHVNAAAIRRKKLTVALDCVNGAGSIACVKLLEKLGCKIKAINCDVTKPFPHAPEPIPKNLVELSHLVSDTKADIGFALDSDADRLAIVSDQGKPIGEELTLALATKFILSKNKNHPAKQKLVITNLSTTKAIDDIVQQFNGIIIRTKIGEVHVSEQLKDLKGLIGGEGNGGVIYPAIGCNRDGLAAMALILNYLAKSKKTIAELVDQLPHYYMVKEKISCHDEYQVEKYLAAVKDLFKGKDLILTEGIKVVMPTKWIHVRASNTEPIIRIIAEGKDKKETKNLIRQVLKSS